MSRSLRRTLAVRFAATMGVGLVAAAAAAYFGTHLIVEHGLDPSLTRRAMVVAFLAVGLLGTGATFVGAWWLAGSAVRPVHEITEQATRVEAGTLDQRIVAHADTDEYRGLVAVLNRMLERLEVAFRNQRRLTADVSHELRSPLTALRGEIEVALRAERNARDYQRVLRSALEEIERLTKMSDDLLLITRAEAGLLRVRRAPTDLSAIVEDTLDVLQPLIDERGLSVERSLAGDAGHALVDPDLLARLMQQLLDNAVKFTPTGGHIRVATDPLKSDGGGVRLVVEDSGPGITPEDLPHLFEPFFRADQARSRGTGTGLGLALAAAIVRLHGGTIQASKASGDGTGARFDVDLPTFTTQPQT